MERHGALATDAVITVQTNRYLNLCGAVAGPAGFIKGQPGTLILSGEAANTFAGNAVVNEGTLQLNKSGVNAMAGDLIVGNNSGTDIARWLQGAQLPSTTDVTVNDGAMLILNDFNEALGALTLDGGEVLTGSGLLTLGGDITARPGSVSGNGSTISGRLGLGSSSRTFTILQVMGAAAYGLRVFADVSGSGGLIKSGAGGLSLTGENTYTGLTTVNDGELAVLSHNALGGTTAGTIVQAGASLGLASAYDASVHVGNEPLTLSGYFSAGAPGYDTSNSWGGPITLLADSTIAVYEDDFLNLTGAVDGAGGLTKIFSGTLILSGSTANTYAGTTYVIEGTLVLDKSGVDGAVLGDLIIGDGSGGPGGDVVRFERISQIANAADVTIAGSGLLDLNGNYDRVDAVTGSGAITLGSGHLVAGHNGSSFTFDGLVSGPGYLWKVGGGTWTLTADNTYLGTTLIETGTLVVNGSQPASDVSIGSAGTLGGTGMVGRITSTGGVLSPGVSPGTLTSSNLLFDTASDFLIELTDIGADQLNVRGKVGLANAELILSAASLLPTEGQEFGIVNNDDTDAVTGTFGGLAEGALVVAGPRQFRITYTGGTGNDVVLIGTNTASLAPSLAIRGTGTNTVVIAWPLSDLLWRLQATTNLATAPVSWTESPPPYQTNGANLQCIEPSPAGHKFYRLHQP